jgi:hypothetical protein
MVKTKEASYKESLPNMSLSVIHPNPPLDLPEFNPKEFCTGKPKEEMKSRPSVRLPGKPFFSFPFTSCLCLGKPLFSHQNPTQLFPSPGNLCLCLPSERKISLPSAVLANL